MINEHLKKENIFLDDWAAKVSGFIRDGIVDHEFYWKSGIKILFLLKEVNGGHPIYCMAVFRSLCAKISAIPFFPLRFSGHGHNNHHN